MVILIIYRVISCLCIFLYGLRILLTSNLEDLYSKESEYLCIGFISYLIIDGISQILYCDKIRMELMMHHVISITISMIGLYYKILPPLWWAISGLAECITVSRCINLFDIEDKEKKFACVRKYLTMYIRLPGIIVVFISLYTIFYEIKSTIWYTALLLISFLFTFDLYCLRIYNDKLNKTD